MRVLILATDIYVRGGIARYTATLASALGEILGPDNIHVLALLRTGDRCEVPAAFHVLGALSDRPSWKAKIQFAEAVLRVARKKYDLIICSHVALAPIAALAGGMFGSPFWVACHDAEVWNRLSLPRLAALKRAQLVLPVSGFTAQKLCEVNGVPVDRIRVLHNAIPTGFAKMLLSKHEASSSPFGWANGRRYILSVGSLARVHAYKGFDRVISTLPRLLTEIPDLQYAIIGAGDNQPCLEALAWQMGVHEKVTFIGRVSDQELANAFHGCDVFVMPSQASKSNGWWHGEGFGRVYVEAGLAGKPVVGGNSGGAAEAVLHGKTGLLVDPSSSEELVSALLRLLQNPDLAAQMGRAGRVWASENFTQRSLQASLRGLVEAFK